MEQIRILIVEDDEDFVFLICSTLEKNPDMEVCGVCLGSGEAVDEALQLSPDIVLMDLNLSGSLDGIEAARKIRLATDARVIILTSLDDPDIITKAAARSFASGYVLKSQFSLLSETIRATAGGFTPQEHFIQTLILGALSPAERTVFDMMLGKKIELQSSPKTLANQKGSILHKLGLRSQQELEHIFHGGRCNS